MKKQNVFQLISLLATPAALAVVGLILLVQPDSASALLSRVLGWGLVLAGVFCGLAAIFRPDNTVLKIIGAMLLLSLGGWLNRNPLALANMGGIGVGCFLIIQGVLTLRQTGRRGVGILSIIVGAVLVVLPLTVSRLILSLCGLAILLAAIAMGISRFRRARLDSGDDDPNIIDAL